MSSAEKSAAPGRGDLFLVRTSLLVTQRAGATWLLGGESRRVAARVHADSVGLLQALCERGAGIARLQVKQAGLLM